MKIKRNIILVIIFSLLLIQCEDLANLAEESGDGPLTTEEVVEGLKTALVIGTDTSTSTLNKLNAYYENPLLKIPLPDEAEQVRSVINKYTSTLQSVPVLNDFLDLDAQFEKVIKSINRSAEDAAKDAAPIFKDAITGLSISDGWDILNGKVPGETGTKSALIDDFDSTAATKYLELQTYNSLMGLYQPKIDAVLDQDLGLGFSANSAWKTLRTNYNNLMGNFAVSTALSIAGLDDEFPGSIKTSSIGEFSTQKALNGLFYVVGQEEKKIRKNPYEWAIDIIQKVFSYIFEE